MRYRLTLQRYSRLEGRVEHTSRACPWLWLARLLAHPFGRRPPLEEWTFYIAETRAPWRLETKKFGPLESVADERAIRQHRP